MTILRNKMDVYKLYRHVPWCSLYMFIKGVHDVWLLTLQYSPTALARIYNVVGRQRNLGLTAILMNFIPTF